MTIDNCVIFDLTDVTNIQFECKECKARFATPIAEWKANIAFCPNCHKSWGKQTGNTQQYLQALRDCLQTLTKSDDDQEFVIRFEVRSASGRVSSAKD